MAIIKKFRIKNFKTKKELIKLDKISIYFGKRKIFEDLNFSLNQGEILGLLGPNGVGKSTIFNIIIGLLKPNYGSIFIDQENISFYPNVERIIENDLEDQYLNNFSQSESKLNEEELFNSDILQDSDIQNNQVLI